MTTPQPPDQGKCIGIMGKIFGHTYLCRYITGDTHFCLRCGAKHE